MEAANTVSPIIEKLRKMIAHEKSAREIGNMHEAEAFAAKIQELLTAHKLGMSEVEFQGREETEPIDWERVDGNELGRGGRKVKVYWRQRIAVAIAKINSCQVVNQNRSGGNAFFFVGRTSDRELAKILYLYLVELGEEMVTKAVRADRQQQAARFCDNHGLYDANIPSYYGRYFDRWMKDYRESWKLGFSEAIQARLTEQYEAMLAAQQSTASNAIVHINADALAVKQFLAGKTFKARAVRASNNNTDGFERGQSTGNAVNLSPNRFNAASGRASRLLGS